MAQRAIGGGSGMGTGATSSAASTPRSEGGGGYMSGNQPNPFASASHGSARGLELGMGGDRGGGGGIGELQRRSTPSILGQELDNLRVSSSPSMFPRPDFGDLRTSAPSAGGYETHGGGGGGGGSVGRFDLRLGGHRARRMSAGYVRAGSPGSMLHEHSAPAFDENYLDLVSRSLSLSLSFSLSLQ